MNTSSFLHSSRYREDHANQNKLSCDGDGIGVAGVLYGMDWGGKAE